MNWLPYCQAAIPLKLICWHLPELLALTHWGRVTHICASKLTIIGPDNGLSPGRRQAIIWTNAGILLIGPLGTNFSENLIGIQTFSFKKMPLKMSSAKWRPFCLGLNVLMPAAGFSSPTNVDFHKCRHIQMSLHLSGYIHPQSNNSLVKNRIYDN